ncbi:hypothetical protein [Streptomyces sp. NPDC021224]|uniref:hypothetical protein n=1 Tax=unclassified Streptomyces TaxID=2593676 RepID=UPI00378B885A
MAGDDTYGKQFAQHYDPAAKALFRTISPAVRAIGQSANGLVRTANHCLKADRRSCPKAGKSAPKLFGRPDVVDDITYPDPPTAIRSGSNHWPPPLHKYWGRQLELPAACRGRPGAPGRWVRRPQLGVRSGGLPLGSPTPAPDPTDRSRASNERTCWSRRAVDYGQVASALCRCLSGGRTWLCWSGLRQVPVIVFTGTAPAGPPSPGPTRRHSRRHIS